MQYPLIDSTEFKPVDKEVYLKQGYRLNDFPFLTLIVLTNLDGAIGYKDLRDNTSHQPFLYPKDLKRFKTMTQNKTVVMGRTTYETVGALSGRLNVVITSRPETYKGLEDVQFITIEEFDDDLVPELLHMKEPFFVIGGRKLYEHCLSKYKCLVEVTRTNKRLKIKPDTTAIEVIEFTDSWRDHRMIPIQWSDEITDTDKITGETHYLRFMTYFNLPFK